MSNRDTLLKILDLARWAPSGDNTQPWRFEIVSDDHIAVHGHDTRDWCLYDFDGHASHMAHGALLETLRIAATGHGLTASWVLRDGGADTSPIYDVRLARSPGLVPAPLLPFIEKRMVQRRPMKTTQLSTTQRDALVAAAGPNYRVEIFSRFGERMRIAKLLWDSAHIRLTCPEAYSVHKEIIEWGALFSKDRIPEAAVGVDPLTGKLMRWVLGSWERVHFFNRFLFGTVAPRIQLDFLPALRCAAHVLVRPRGELKTTVEYVELGCAMQRIWLTASASGLMLQPEMTPLIFRWYARNRRPFTQVDDLMRAAGTMAGSFELITKASEDEVFGFFCRIGESREPRSRSLRLSMDELKLK